MLPHEWSCIESSTPVGGTGTTNLNCIPGFGDAEYRLSPCSALLNAGNPALLPPDTQDLNLNQNRVEELPYDRDGNRRRAMSSEVDIGAYQYTCDGDINRDGLINGADLGLLLGAWGQGPAPMQDLDCNGTVNGADLGIVLAVWNTPCDQIGLEQARGSGGLDEDVMRLMAYLGTDELEEATRALESMPFDRMFETLDTFLGVRE